MKINSFSISFKGYDAAPLKAVHIEQSTGGPIKAELKKIAQQENFELRQGLDYYRWPQDTKTIIEKNKKPFIVANGLVGDEYLEETAKKYGIKGTSISFITVGGNSFIGKYPNGERFMLVGEDEFEGRTIDNTAEAYGIERKNIIPIPQQNYHLDVFMRPIGYPYILIDNPKLTRQKLTQLNKKGYLSQYLNLQKDFNSEELKRSMKYASHKKTVEALKKAGFIPIEIAGVYSRGINFMNAIVNSHPDGTISYITNSTSCKNPFISKLQEEFEADLRKNVPNIDKVYFVSGQKDIQTENLNYMMYNLNKRGGGLHCMTLEEVDFDAWG